MADSKNPKQSAMSMDAFRAKKAGGSSTGQKPTGGSPSKSILANSTGSVAQSSNSRPSSASRGSARKRSSSVDNLSSKPVPSLQQRQDKVKQMRDKQVEERKKKNEERRLAFEERRRQREEDDKMKWAGLKEQAAKQRPGSGRKLPNLPEALRRPASASTAHSRPSGLPKPLKATVPSGAGLAKSPTKSPAQSSSSLSSDSSPKQSPASTPASSHGRGSLGNAKATSETNLDAGYRRCSAGNLQRPNSASTTKSRPSSLCSPHPKPVAAKSHDSLAPSTRTVTKAHSTSALHNIGIDRSPLHIPKKRKERKDPPKPKAGMLDEGAAKQALAERRKKAREEAERQANLDKGRQEEERKRKEEEDKILAEEIAKEEERLQQLAELLKQQEDERLKKALEEKEQHDREEAERLIEEQRLKEEERKVREEQEKKAREEAEKKAKEDEERRKQEEIERHERRKRVEEIMCRTRQTKTGSPNTEEPSTSPTQEHKELDAENTKRKVNEILQKVKDRSGSPQHINKLETSSSLSSLDSESDQVAESNQDVEEYPESSSIIKPIDSADSIIKGLESGACDANDKESVHYTDKVGGSEKSHDHSGDTAAGSVVKVRVRISESKGATEVRVNGKELTRTLSRNVHHDNGELNKRSLQSREALEGIPSINVEDENHERSSSLCLDSAGAVNGLEQREVTDVRQDNSTDKIEDSNGSAQDMLDEDEQNQWRETESIMHTKENEASERLENSGIVAEGVDDEMTEEGQLWKVIEGLNKRALVGTLKMVN